MDKLKQNLALIIGLGIPVLMVLLIASIIYVPRWFDTTPPPAHDFMYMVADDYGSIDLGQSKGYYPPAPAYMPDGAFPKYTYRVTDGKLVRTENALPSDFKGTAALNVPKFYLHRVSTNLSMPITFADAEKYTLDTSAKSPDGWEIVRGQCGGGFFPFYNSSCDYNARYLKKGSTAIKLELNLAKDDYREPYFAWILE